MRRTPPLTWSTELQKSDISHRSAPPLSSGVSVSDLESEWRQSPVSENRIKHTSLKGNLSRRVFMPLFWTNTLSRSTGFCLRPLAGSKFRYLTNIWIELVKYSKRNTKKNSQRLRKLSYNQHQKMFAPNAVLRPFRQSAIHAGSWFRLCSCYFQSSSAGSSGCAMTVGQPGEKR